MIPRIRPAAVLVGTLACIASQASAAMMAPSVVLSGTPDLTFNGASETCISTEYFADASTITDPSFPAALPRKGPANKYTFSDGTVIWADADPYLSINFSTTNNTSTTQHYTVNSTLPISPTLTAPTSMAGSVGFSVTHAMGIPAGVPAVLSVPTGSYLYTAKIDGVDAITLLDDTFSFSVPTQFDTQTLNPAASAGLPGVTLVGPAVNSQISITLDFNLTPGDTVAFTGIFVTLPNGGIPEPASLSLLALGLGGCLLRRRRA